MKFKTLLLFVILMGSSVFFLAGCQISDRLSPQNSPLLVKPTTQVTDDSSAQPNIVTAEKLELHALEDGQTALDLLKANAELETKQYDFGVFIESVNGLKGDGKHFWALYVNDVKSQTGADSTILKKGDVAKWVWEEIQL